LLKKAGHAFWFAPIYTFEIILKPYYTDSMKRYQPNIPKNRKIHSDEKPSPGQICISSEVILYSIPDIVKMSGWSQRTVQKLFNDPSFPSIDYGKRKLVENHALIRFLSVKRERIHDNYWRKEI